MAEGQASRPLPLPSTTMVAGCPAQPTTQLTGGWKKDKEECALSLD